MSDSTVGESNKSVMEQYNLFPVKRLMQFDEVMKVLSGMTEHEKLRLQAELTFMLTESLPLEDKDDSS